MTRHWREDEFNHWRHQTEPSKPRTIGPLGRIVVVHWSCTPGSLPYSLSPSVRLSICLGLTTSQARPERQQPNSKSRTHFKRLALLACGLRFTARISVTNLNLRVCATADFLAELRASLLRVRGRMNTSESCNKRKVTIYTVLLVPTATSPPRGCDLYLTTWLITLTNTSSWCLF